MKIEEPIYLDQDGYNEFLKEIEKIKEDLRKNDMGRKEAFDAGAGDGWDSPEFEEIERNNTRLVGELQRRYSELQRIVIMEKHKDSDTIDIGDIILANMIFSPDDTEEITFKLVATSGSFGGKMQEVSINSPLGAAVYKKQIGDTCSYSVNNRNFSVYLKQKLDFTKDALILHNMTKAFVRYPTAFCFYDNFMIKVFKSEYKKSDNKSDFGKIIEVNNNGIFIQALNGVYIIKELQKEGKKRQTVKEFLCGNKLNTGEYFK